MTLAQLLAALDAKAQAPKRAPTAPKAKTPKAPKVQAPKAQAPKEIDAPPLDFEETNGAIYMSFLALPTVDLKAADVEAVVAA